MDCESAVSPPNRFNIKGPAASLTDLKKDLYRFRPNESVTLGEFAGMTVNGLQIPLNITAARFNGVPRGTPHSNTSRLFMTTRPNQKSRSSITKFATT